MGTLANSENTDEIHHNQGSKSTCIVSICLGKSNQIQRVVKYSLYLGLLEGWPS